MKAKPSGQFNYEQKKFLGEIDPAVMADTARKVQAAKAKFHRRKLDDLNGQIALWERQAKILGRDGDRDRKLLENEYQSFRKIADKPIAVPSGFDHYIPGKNPLFYPPNFFNIGSGETSGGATSYSTWTEVGGRRLPYCEPNSGKMGVKIGAFNPGGNSYFTTGLANVFYSQSFQNLPLSASFIVYGRGTSFGIGLGYSRGWLRLGIEAWVSGPSRPSPVHFYFVNDFWSSVPSPWVTEMRNVGYETFSTPLLTIPVLPGDIVMAAAVIEQGAVAGGLFSLAKSEFLVEVSPMRIG